MMRLSLDRVLFLLFAMMIAGFLWFGIDTMRQVSRACADAQAWPTAYREAAR